MHTSQALRAALYGGGYRRLAGVDALLHGGCSGLATRMLCERMYQGFGGARYARLVKMSNGHLYHPGQHKTYRT